ncbi:MAG: peptide deformylase [Rickettsiales bacterium]|nr:peptide deformylase [Rickettsiales bacterium]|tara:strand:- start:2017 stop:2538 length:522 start_codon:yes stop_codon:yes gene_type:complete
MTILKILTIPDPRLKHKSSNVESFDKELKKTVKNMFETLYASGNGIGLAAPQVDIRKRIVVIDLNENGKSSPITFINPKIIKLSDEKFINQEGCLSVPEYYADVERAKEVEVEWHDDIGVKYKKNLSGLLSICIQHEIDHLDGILFIDHLSALKRKMAIQKIKKTKKNINNNE